MSEAKCVWCGVPFAKGEASYPGDLYLPGRYHPRCLMSQERGDLQPPRPDDPPMSRGLYQLLPPAQSALRLRHEFAVTSPHAMAKVVGITEGVGHWSPGYSRYALGVIELRRYCRRREERE